MLESVISDKLNYQKLSPEEMKKRGILGRLAGIIADYKNPTRNGRLYSEKLWDRTFDDPIVQEKIKNRCFFGELGHPADRLEVDMEKVAICMAEQPKKGKDGKLYSVFDILDTPNGRILKTLCDYGCTIGVSSRGNGETDVDAYGNESVIPDSYQCECWDAVLVPAVESARMSYITESIGNKTLKQALSESLEKANANDKKVMTETLKELNIDYSDSEQESNNTNNDAANDDGAELLKTLQESILAKETAEAKITELQEKLSVCYAKEATMEEDLIKYKSTIRNLSESASKARTLQEQLNSLQAELNESKSAAKTISEKYSALLKEQKSVSANRSKLVESLSDKDNQLKTANQKVESLTEQIKTNASNYEAEKAKLVEDYETLKKDYKIKQSNYSTKLTNANKLVEQYRETARNAVNRYIESKATVLGLKSGEIKNKLSKNYSFNEIDAVCEDLSKYKLQMNSLPFDVRSVSGVSITESKKIPDFEIKSRLDDGDDVDDDLIRLAKNMAQE